MPDQVRPSMHLTDQEVIRLATANKNGRVYTVEAMESMAEARLNQEAVANVEHLRDRFFAAMQIPAEFFSPPERKKKIRDVEVEVVEPKQLPEPLP